jgi:hypothetical protein
MFDSNTPIKYQEVARLAVQITGKDRKDDLFLLTGIRNILEGR